MTCDEMAALHLDCFTRPRPWRADEFAALLASPLCFSLTAPAGFLIGRVIADEAELLTLAIHPHARRQGHARHLVQTFAATATARGAARAFLEVAADNPAAIALYLACGYSQAGRRKGYYAGPDGPADALLFSLPLPAIPA